MSKKRNVSPSADGSPGLTAPNVDHDAIVAFAYELWLGRGGPIGTPEVDWFRAEELLRSRAESPAVAPVQAEVSAEPSTVPAALAATSGT